MTHLASRFSPPRFVQHINIFFCLKEHLKTEGPWSPFFWIKPLFGQYKAIYMILLPFFDTFLSHWPCDPFFALKKGLFQKKGDHGPSALRRSFQQKKKLYVDRTSAEIFGMPNEPFLTLFRFISPGNLKISGWKFYGRLLFLAPTYPESFI